MKRLHLFIALAIMAMVAGCSYNELTDDLSVSPSTTNEISLVVETRAETYEGVTLDRDYFVTAEDLENYVKFRRSTSEKSNFAIKEVKPYGLDRSQTLFYILNYDEGWEVVAADKRVQPTLAHGDSGTFSMDCDNEPMKFWMNMLADGVLQTRRRVATEKITSTTTTNTTTAINSSEVVKSSEEQYVDFWKEISPSESGTKGDQIIGPITPPDDTPYFQYLITTEQRTVYDKIGELLSTEWGQGSPWNTYCPLKTDGSGLRAPAGCTAVAGAQLLYYFAQNFGWEISAPTFAICNGYINNYNRNFDNISYDVWNNMATDYTKGVTELDKTAVFIAYVSSLSKTKYKNDGSSASPSNFMEGIENLYDISSTISNLWSYDENIIINNIKEGLPVFIWGAENIFGGGHSWVIDGYRKEIIRTTKYYFRSIAMLTPAQLANLDKTDANYITTEDSLVAETIHMNWGYSGLYDAWYSFFPEDWSPREGKTYDVVMRMIYDFTQN